MSVYRSTFALTKLFGITEAEGSLVQDRNDYAAFPFFSELGQDITTIGYSTRLKFTDFMPTNYQPPKLKNIEAALSSNLHELNDFILQLIETKEQSNLPVVITHNFTKGEVDISAQSPVITAVIESALSNEHGKHYRLLVWDTFELLKATSDDSGAIYLLNAKNNTVTALSNSNALQIQFEAKPGKER